MIKHSISSKRIPQHIYETVVMIDWVLGKQQHFWWILCTETFSGNKPLKISYLQYQKKNGQKRIKYKKVKNDKVLNDLTRLSISSENQKAVCASK